MILAGDIGGTKTTLALMAKTETGDLTCVHEQTFASREYSVFDDLLTAFLPANVALSAACFGVAGPVVEQRCRTTNLPWVLDAELLKQRFNIERVRLLNDLEAMALGMLQLPEQELIELNPNAEVKIGNKAVIAAGTGLGEAILYWDGSRYHAIATEGGHTDLAPTTAQQDALLTFLRSRYPDHVSYERVLCGDGFSHLYDFLLEHDFASACLAVPNLHDAEQGDRNAMISRLGLAGEDALCAEALRLFVEFYGAEAGNWALKTMALGGVYIGGGIAAKILPAMQNGDFIQAFKAKGRFQGLLDKVSVKLALNPRTPLLGAGYYFC